MKYLLIDFSNIMFSTFHASVKDSSIQNEEEFIGMWKHFVITSILDKKNKIKPDKIILCLDSGSWRSDFFKFYKAKRKLKKLENKEEYDFMYKIANEFVEDIKNNLPWIVIGVKKAEGDDIIAVLTHHLKEQNEVVILSIDKDLKQLIGDNVKFYNYKKDCFEELDIDKKEYLLRLILHGDSTDGIPSLPNPDDIFISGKRQSPFGPKRIDKVLEEGLEEFLNENDLKVNWNRNRKLIELSEQTIPEFLWNKIIDKYLNYDIIEADFVNILNFLRRSKLMMLQKRTNEFF